MTALDYVKHYVSFPDALIFFGLAFGIVIIVNLIVFGFAKIAGSKPNAILQDKVEATRYHYSLWMQHFYELFFSATSILFFCAAFYLLTRFFDIQPYKSYITKYSDLVLLILILISCLLTTFTDRVLIRLNLITLQNRGPIRFMGMIYMVVIFCYVKFIYENDNYDTYITYFLGLMIGRFVYFDASFKDFWYTIKKGFANFPLLILALGCTAALSYYGFKTQFLIKHIGVITNVYIQNLFVCVAIFIIHHLHPEKWIRANAAVHNNESEVDSYI